MRRTLFASLTVLPAIMAESVDTSAETDQISIVPGVSAFDMTSGTSSDVIAATDATDSTERDLLLLPGLFSVPSTVQVQESRSGLLGLRRTKTTTIVNGPTVPISPVYGTASMGGPMLSSSYFGTGTFGPQYGSSYSPYGYNIFGPRRLEDELAAPDVVATLVSSDNADEQTTMNKRQFAGRSGPKKNFLQGHNRKQHNSGFENKSIGYEFHPYDSHNRAHNYVEDRNNVQQEVTWIPVPVDALPEWMVALYSNNNHKSEHHFLRHHGGQRSARTSPVETKFSIADETVKESVPNEDLSAIDEISSIVDEEVSATENSVSDVIPVEGVN